MYKVLFVALALVAFASAQKTLTNNPNGITFPSGYQVTNASAVGCDCINGNVTGLCPAPTPVTASPTASPPPAAHNPCSDIGAGVTQAQFQGCFSMISVFFLFDFQCSDASIPLVNGQKAVNLSNATCNAMLACDAVFINTSCLYNSQFWYKLIFTGFGFGPSMCVGAGSPTYTIPSYTINNNFAHAQCTNLIAPASNAMCPAGATSSSTSTSATTSTTPTTTATSTTPTTTATSTTPTTTATSTTATTTATGTTATTATTPTTATSATPPTSAATAAVSLAALALAALAAL